MKAPSPSTSILTGKRHVLEYVFGERRPAWLTAYTTVAYNADPVFAYQHAIVAEIVEPLVSRGDESKPLRILEVGAGTSGLTDRLLPLLPRGATTYLYTDVTRAFFAEARQRFRGAEDVISYGLYNINKSPAGNNTPQEHFDLIVAFDVLHCAQDLEQSLKWLGSLLRSGGILANEQLTKNRPGHLLIPGIMPGYTDFEDERLGRYQTLFTPAEWRRKLAAAGFVNCRIFPEDESVLDELGQGVIVAMKP